MDVQGIDHVAATSGPGAAVQPHGQLSAFPDPPDSAQHRAQNANATLHDALSQLVGGGAKVSVQYRVVGNGEIVTLFTNADTGEVITQFPSEAMVLIAQFFNQLAGTVVDRTA